RSVAVFRRPHLQGARDEVGRIYLGSEEVTRTCSLVPRLFVVDGDNLQTSATGLCQLPEFFLKSFVRLPVLRIFHPRFVHVRYKRHRFLCLCVSRTKWWPFAPPYAFTFLISSISGGTISKRSPTIP